MLRLFVKAYKVVYRPRELAEVVLRVVSNLNEEVVVRPFLELELEGEIKGVVLLDELVLPPKGVSSKVVKFRMPEYEGKGVLRGVLERGGVEVARDEEPIAVLEEGKEPMRVVFVWHHHQAPSYMPSGDFHSAWPFVHVFEGQYAGFGKGGPYAVHLEIHERHRTFKDVDHLSPSLLEQWRIAVSRGYTYRGENVEPGDPRIQAVERTLKKYRELAARRGIEVLASPYAHPVQGLIIRLFRERGLGELARELLAWQLRYGFKLVEEVLGVRPRGVWTPEMFWDMELLPIYAECGVQYTVLCEQHFLKAGGEKDSIYEPYLLEEPITGNRLVIFFRDRELSDWIGFKTTYEDAEEARRDARRFVLALLDRYLKFRGKVCVLALDGENWMLPNDEKKFSALFLDHVLSYLEQREDLFEVITLSEALSKVRPRRLLNYVPWGSWIGLSDYQWMGGERDELWRYVLDRLRWLAAYLSTIPAEVRRELLEKDDTALARAFKAAAIALDSDFYWYANIKEYRSAVKAWADEAARIAREQLSKVYAKPHAVLDNVIAVKVENGLTHPISLRLVVTNREERREVRLTIKAESYETVYLPRDFEGGSLTLCSPEGHKIAHVKLKVQ